MSESQHNSATNEFFAECDELLQRIVNALNLLEKQQGGADLVDSLYRDIHTIKGAAQLFGFVQIGDVAHVMESSLDPVRKGSVSAGPHLIEALFGCINCIDEIVQSVKKGEKKDFASSMMQVIPRLIEVSLDPTAEWTVPAAEPSASAALGELQSALSPATASAPAPVPTPALESAPVSQTVAAVMPAAVAERAEHPVPASGATPLASESQESSSTIRVSVGLLDKLMALMGEMVLVRNQVLQRANQSDDLEFLNLSQRLDVVTTEIQGEVMKTRMQPIGNVLSKFQRVVRDLSRELSKKIELELFGMETELDKTLLEAVKDPIMHIVRNSCDHGIETPEERAQSGKPEGGKIAIRAYHEGGQVVVEISDNGRGLNKDKLIKKAIERGMITQEKASQMSERDAFALIFSAGFSTAAKVTNVSGRGVGMDVVKSNVEKIGGLIELNSQLGQGMTIRLKIPLTLAIVPAMIVRNGTDRYAIPQLKLVELVRADYKEGAQQIEWLQGKPVFRLRGQLLPLISLTEVLVGSNGEATGAAMGRTDATIVVLSAEGNLFGLIVDEVQDTADIVVKPLNSFLKSLSVYSGATVMGDGAVCLILDVNGIASSMGLFGERDADAASKESETSARDKELQEFLLLRLSSPTKHAIPLGLVHRLEEFPRSSVEMSGSTRVVRYRNTILPLVQLDTILGYQTEEKTDPSTNLSVFVCQKGGRLYGVEVREILDVFVSDQVVDDALEAGKGILGNIVTESEVIVVLDILGILDRYGGSRRVKAPSAVSSPNVASSKAGNGGKILFAEDTVFFKRQVMGVLERAGYEVVHAVNGEEALATLQAAKAGEFDLILTDIEMPKLNGFQLVEAIRKDSVWNRVPVIALTTCYNSEKIQQGKNAGFNEYLEKLAPDVLLSTLEQFLNRERKELAA